MLADGGFHVRVKSVSFRVCGASNTLLRERPLRQTSLRLGWRASLFGRESAIGSQYAQYSTSVVIRMNCPSRIRNHISWPLGYTGENAITRSPRSGISSFRLIQNAEQFVRGSARSSAAAISCVFIVVKGVPPQRRLRSAVADA